MIAPKSGETLSTMTSATATVSSITGAPSTAIPTDNGVAGHVDGPGSTATFNQPQGITTDGVSLYVSDSNNGTLRKIQ